MSKVQLTFIGLVGAASLTLLTAGAPRALAAYAAQGASATPSNQAAPPAVTLSQKAVELSPITVRGLEHLPVPVALQIVKKALARPWSTAAADRDKLVCKFVTMVGSHLHTMICATNRRHLRQAAKTQLSLQTLQTGGGIPAEVGDWMDQHPMNEAAMNALLKKLPPADSTYTLRITDHGKPAVDYVFVNGALVKVVVYKYQKKAGQATP